MLLCCHAILDVSIYAPNRSRCAGRHLKATSQYIADVEFSPLLGGFVTVLSGGRGFFLTAPNARFDRQVFIALTLYNTIMIYALLYDLVTFLETTTTAEIFAVRHGVQ